MLSDAIRTSIRRHLDTPAIGLASQYTFAAQMYDGGPYYASPSALEDRMLTLAPAEESVLTGLPIADVTLTGTPVPGASITIEANGVPLIVYAVAPNDLAALEPLNSIAVAISLVLNASNDPYQAAPARHSLSTVVSASVANLTIQSLIPEPFSIQVVGSGVGAFVSSQGTMPSVAQRFQSACGMQTVYGLVPICDYLESAIAGSSDNATFLKIEEVGFDPNETARRVQLYTVFRRRLASFFFGQNGRAFLRGTRRGGCIA